MRSKVTFLTQGVNNGTNVARAGIEMAVVLGCAPLEEPEITMRRLNLAMALMFLASCGDDSPGSETSDVSVDGGADAGDVSTDAETTGDTDVSTSDADAGTGDASDGTDDPDVNDDGVVRAMLDFGVTIDVGDPAAFFDFPYPSDLRLLEDGTPDVTLFPNPANKPIVRSLVDAALRTRGFPLLPVVWIRFDGPVAHFDAGEIVEMSQSAPALMMVIDPSSDHYGELVPIIAQSLESDRYVPENVVAIAPVPGFILEPSTTYAVVILTHWLDADGNPLGNASRLTALATGGGAPTDEGLDGVPFAELEALHAPLWPVLDELGVDLERVAAATVFTTNDPVQELFDLGNDALARFDLTIDDLHVDEPDGATNERFCELVGHMTVPEFQTGEPPYDAGGVFEFDEAGHLISNRETTIPVEITLPRMAMPAGGFPLSLYVHGSGGLSEQVVERGPDGTSGQGPAWVLAAHGIAAASTAMPINPERVPGASDIAYINFANLGAFPDTFRQGAIEQRLFLEALVRLEIDADLVASCTGLDAGGLPAFFFDSSSIVAMGQSMGGMYVNLIGATTPEIRALAPTGAGGFWSYFILQTDLIPGAAGLLRTMLNSGELSFMHPVMQLLQTAWNNAEPMAYVPRLAANPLLRHPVRSLYVPVGQGDHYFPTPVFDAMALAMENEQVGEVVWPAMQTALAYRGLDGVIDYPVALNRANREGIEYTGVVVQYAGDGVHDPHEIFQHDERVKHQYGCFFETFINTGVGRVVAPGLPGTPCDE